MWVTETLDAWVKNVGKTFTRVVVRKLRARDAAKVDDEGYPMS